MQLHAVRGRAVALICGRPNSKNSRLDFRLLPFSTRSKGHDDRWPAAGRNRMQFGSPMNKTNKTGSPQPQPWPIGFLSRAETDERTSEGSEVHIRCHRNISASPGARRSATAEQSAVLPQPHIDRRKAPLPLARISRRQEPTRPRSQACISPAPRPQARRAALRRARARPGRRAAPRRRAAARDGVRGRRGAGGRRRRAGASRDAGVGPRLAAAAAPVRGVAHHRGDRRHRAGRVAVEASPFLLRPVLFLRRPNPARLAQSLEQWSLAQHSTVRGRLRDTRRNLCASGNHS